MIAATLRMVLRSADGRARAALCGAVALLLAGTLLASLAPLALKALVDRVAAGGSASGGAASAHGLLAPGFAYLACLCVGRWLGECRLLLSGMAEQRLHVRLSTRFFAHLLELPLSFHLGQRTGAVARTVTQAASASQVLVASSLALVSIGVEISTAGAVLAVFGHPALTGLLLASAVAYFLVFAATSARHRRQAVAVAAANMDAAARLADGLLNVEAIKTFSGQAQAAAGFAERAAILEQRWLALHRQRALTGSAVAAVFAATVAAVLAVAAWGAMSGSLTVGAFVMVAAYVLQLVRPLEQLGTVWRDLAQASEFVRPMLDILRLPTESGPTQFPAAAPAQGHGQRTRAASLAFVDVHHAYTPGRPVLTDLQLDIAPGRTVALVGASGCGKSTIVRLALRLLEPQQGRILLDGVPLTRIPHDVLRAQIAVVAQDTALLDDTVAANIALARPRASRGEIEEAARGAQLHSFVRGLPAGYDTPVGERGMRLSGGQRQRIAIARVLLARPRLALLDEATSMLDGGTERKVLQGLKNALEDCSVLMVTHRLASAQHADEIVVVARGHVAERGSHTELLVRSGHYAALWRAQAAGQSPQAEPSAVDARSASSHQ